MKFSEMIEEYKQGKLSGEEAAALESDIEKHEAIADYIAERDDIGLHDLTLGSDPIGDEKAEAQDFTKKIRRQIRRSFLKAGLITGAIVLAAALFIMFALPGLVSKAYYDPTEVVKSYDSGITVSRLDVDLAVYTELFVPERIRQQSTANGEGYGNYSVFIPQVQSISGNFRDTAGFIKKGMISLYDPSLLKMPPVNCLEPMKAGLSGENLYESNWDFNAKEFIDYYPENGQRCVYVTLDHAMSYTEFEAWCRQNGVEPYWCAVCSGGKLLMPNPCGFLACAPVAFVGVSDEPIDKDYPLLTAADMLAKRSSEFSLSYGENDVKQHLVSMLSYAAEKNEGITMLSGAEGIAAELREAAQKVEANGFEIYGFMICADKADAERLTGLSGIVSMFNNGAAE
ncbi:MAG: anti sigma factor C-terminal domain-containing protein [Clostridia bacterium]|nr:anti sigma factor C-terminal domain-containing protein [Clostridia bacterium]